MKDCCKEYDQILQGLDSVKAESPESTHERIDKIKAFVKAEFDRHVNEAGEASCAGD
jgi:hypothetical protein